MFPVKMEEDVKKSKQAANVAILTQLNMSHGRRNLFKKIHEKSFRKWEAFVPTMCQE